MSGLCTESIKSLYLKYLEDYILRAVRSKLPDNIFEHQFESELFFEKIYQDMEIKPITDSANDTAHSVIWGNPGDGKSFFCMRLAIAVIHNEESLLSKYKCILGNGSIPIFITLSYFKKFAFDKFEDYLLLTSQPDTDFYEVAKFTYKLSCYMFPDNFHKQVSENDFISFFLVEKDNLLFIFDGYDEIFSESAQGMCKKFFSTVNNAIMTSRYTEKKHVKEKLHGTSEYSISVGIIENFARGLTKSIYGDDETELIKCERIINQLNQSYYRKLDFLTKNALTLSILISFSLAELNLPENKAELYNHLIDFYLTRYVNKKTNRNLGYYDALSILSYLAYYMTSKKMITIGKDELSNVIFECYNTLTLQKEYKINGYYISPDSIIDELLMSGLLEEPFCSNKYRFMLHREIQDFFCAKAIEERIVFAELGYYDRLNFVCNQSQNSDFMRTIVLFALLLDEEEAIDFIESLIAYTESKDNANNSEVLFSLLYENAIKRNIHKKKILSLVFKFSVSEDALLKVIDLLELKNDTSVLLEEFIKEEAVASIRRSDKTLEYGYAYGLVLVAKAAVEFSDPFFKIEQLLYGSSTDIYIASQSMIVLSWIVYGDIQVAPKIKGCAMHRQQEKMSTEIHDRLIEILTTSENELILSELSSAFRESALFFWKLDNKFLNEELLQYLIEQLNNNGYKRYLAVLLSIFPVDLEKLPSKCLVNDDIKDFILKSFETDMKEHIYESAIYRFRTMLVTGIISKDDIVGVWPEVEVLYDGYKETAYGPTIRWVENTAFFMPRQKSFPANDSVYRVEYRNCNLTDEAHAFLLFSELKKESDLYRLFLLYRRGVFDKVYKNDIYITVEELLQETKKDTVFYLVNKALMLSGVTKGKFSDIVAGYEFLHQEFDLTSTWKPVLMHFCTLYDGLILRYWIWLLSDKSINFFEEKCNILKTFKKNTQLIVPLKEFLILHIDAAIKSFAIYVYNLRKGIVERNTCKEISGEKYFYVATFGSAEEYRLIANEDASKYVFEKQLENIVDTDEVINLFFENIDSFLERDCINFCENIF